MGEKPVPTPREDACSYAAGIYEGEGTVGAYLAGYGKHKLRRPQIELRIEMNDKDIIRFLAETFGGNFVPRKRSAQVCFNEPNLVTFLKAVYPYLKGKRRRTQAALVFKLYKMKQQYLGRKDAHRCRLLADMASRINSYNYKRTPRDYTYSTDDIVQTASLGEEVAQSAA